VAGERKKVSEAAEKVGLAGESLSRALSKPCVAEHSRTKVLRSLAMAAARASVTKINLPLATTKWSAAARRASFWALPASSPKVIDPEPVPQIDDRGEGTLWATFALRSASRSAKRLTSLNRKGGRVV
jgi:hypothetical protein